MHRMLGGLAKMHRRWKTIEEDLARSSLSRILSGGSELLGARRESEQQEHARFESCSNSCCGLTRDFEIAVRSLRVHVPSPGEG